MAAMKEYLINVYNDAFERVSEAMEETRKWMIENHELDCPEYVDWFAIAAEPYEPDDEGTLDEIARDYIAESMPELMEDCVKYVNKSIYHFPGMHGGFLIWSDGRLSWIPWHL